MSSRNSPTPKLDVSTRRAERLAAWLVLAASGGAVVLLDSVPGWTQLIAAGGVGAVALGLWRAGWIGSSRRIVQLPWPPGQLSADTRVFRDAIWLRWTGGTVTPCAMFLTRGDLRAGELRALSVRLRTQALARALPEARTRSSR